MHHNQQDNTNYNNRRQYYGDNYQPSARHNTGYNHPHQHPHGNNKITPFYRITKIYLYLLNDG